MDSVGLNTLWVLLAAFLVFFMQAGFGMVEAGFIRAKNTSNILMKNFLDFALGSLFFYIIGYGLMFGEGNGFLGLSGFLMDGAPNLTQDGSIPPAGMLPNDGFFDQVQVIGSDFNSWRGAWVFGF